MSDVHSQSGFIASYTQSAIERAIRLGQLDDVVLKNIAKDVRGRVESVLETAADPKRGGKEEDKCKLMQEIREKLGKLSYGKEILTYGNLGELQKQTCGATANNAVEIKI